ncbi:MAG: hypothetical protein JO300_03870 [Silvibacterium sp.]|nr:hypothetical protein [Silvibacterium sp.]
MSRNRLCFRIPGPAFLCTLLVLSVASASAQVFTVAPEGLEAKMVEFQPTNVAISTVPLTTHNRQDLLRFLQAEQGFTMRPLPISTITLKANGPMEPSGSDYMNTVREKGLAAKAGERVVITDIKIEKDRILLDFNGGPEHKHKFLRHIQIGMDPNMTAPIVQDSGQAPSGTRIALVFPHDVPDMTGMQVEALVKPIVDFNLKNPVQAYADTLPPWLKKSIMDHQVLVGMNTDMVIASLGQPRSKVREREGQMPFEEWIYGEPPDPVQFVRINGNRVIRVEVAKVGESPEIRTENEMGDYWDKQAGQNTRVVKLGDQAPAQPGAESGAHKPPSLRLPGETLPADSNPATPQMGPVQFPKDQTPKDQTKDQSPNQSPNGQQGAPSQSGQPASNPSQSAPQTAPSQPAPTQSAPPASNPLVASGGTVQ